jgi:two-component system sensor histidine kinase AgrC
MVVLDIVMAIMCLFFSNISLMLLYKKFKEIKIRFLKEDVFFFIASVIGQFVLENMGYNFGTFGGYIYSILLISIIYRESLIDAFQYYLCAMVFIEVSKLIIMIPLFIMLHQGFKIEIIVINFIDVMGIFVFTIISIKIFVLKNYYDKVKNILEKVNYLLINLIIFVIVLKLVADYEFNFFQKYFFVFLVIFILFISISLLFARYTAKIKEQQMEINTYTKYNPIILELADDIKSRQHDFKNHLNTIYGIIETTEEKELKSQLERYIINLNDSLKDSDEIITVNNKLIAAIIYIKNCFAREEKIKFYYEVDCDLSNIKLKEYEISELLNNLLDNSFKAVMNEVEEQRKVDLKIFFDDNNFCIHIENGGLTLKPSEINKIFNKGFSTKEEKGHGYGLYNVKKIVQAYNGKIELSVNNNKLEMDLYIPQ